MLLILKTIARRIALPAVVLLVWAPAANAWSWPVQGSVLQPFAYDAAHPYAAGQHRGIDIGADSAGESVVAPAAGTVSFAGSVPTSGKSVTIQTADGYSVTLTHLGSILVVKGATVAEQDAVGTIGPSGTPEEDSPYLHLGIRVTADPEGYVDPLQFLPALPATAPAADDSATPQPAASAPAAPADPAPSSGSARSTTSKPAASQRRHVDHADGRSRATPVQSRSTGDRADTSSASETNDVQSSPSPARHVTAPHPAHTTLRTGGQAIVPDHADGGFRPLPAPAPQAAVLDRPRRLPPAPLLPLVLNGLAALVALAAAVAAGRRRSSPRGAELIRLQPPPFEPHLLRHAA